MTAAPPAKSTRKPTSRTVPTKAVTRERPPTASRVRKERDIIQHAEIQFAQFGFQGASLENIAVAAGISRHNLLYYFPSKEALYQRVLDDVLNAWLAGMQDLSESTDPETALRQYIRAKLRYSREHPHGAKVFTKEVIALNVKVGDRVLFGKYSGQTVKVNGDELLVMKEDDLFAVVEK